MKNLKIWFNENRLICATIIFFISSLLSCANLFSKIHSLTMLIIAFCLLGTGIGIMIYDKKHRREEDE